MQLAGAANTLVIDAQGQIHADNTDGLGLVADITRNAGRSACRGSDVLLVGPGGAAAGVLGPLLEQQPRQPGGVQPHRRPRHRLWWPATRPWPSNKK